MAAAGQRNKRGRELPHVRSQGQRPRVPGCDGAGKARRSHPAFEVREAAGRSYLAPEARGGSREDQPEERFLSRHRRAQRSYPTLKVRNNSSKEIPLVQRDILPGNKEDCLYLLVTRNLWPKGNTYVPSTHGTRISKVKYLATTRNHCLADGHFRYFAVCLVSLFCIFRSSPAKMVYNEYTLYVQNTLSFVIHSTEVLGAVLW